MVRFRVLRAGLVRPRGLNERGCASPLPAYVFFFLFQKVKHDAVAAASKGKGSRFPPSTNANIAIVALLRLDRSAHLRNHPAGSALCLWHWLWCGVFLVVPLHKRGQAPRIDVAL